MTCPAHAPACQQGGVHPRPVIAPGSFVDPRRPPELSPNDHRHVVEQAALIKVLYQSAEPLVQLRTVVAHQGEVLAVAVPSPVGKRHAADAGLHQSPCEEQLVVDGRRPVVLEVIGLAVAVALPNCGRFLGHIEGLEQPARRQYTQCSLDGGVHSLHHTVGIDLAAHAIEARPQPSAIRELGDGDLIQFQVRHSRAFGLKRRIRGSEEPGLADVRPGHVPRSPREPDKRRHAEIDWALQLCDRRPDARSAAKSAQRILAPAGHALERVVLAGRADNRANDSELGHERSDPREHLANLNAGDRGRDWLELAANLDGRLGLDVPHVLMGRAAGQKNVDDGFMPRWYGGLGLRAEQVGQRKAGGSHAEQCRFARTGAARRRRRTAASEP